MMMQAITDRLTGLDGKIGISYIDLEEEKELFFGNSRIFQGSGAIMLMALVECFKQMEEGKIKDDDLHRIHREDCMQAEDPSYGVLRFLHDGVELTISDLYNLMSTVSDNMAFNKLVDILGRENIQKTFHDLGYRGMQLNRKIDEEEAMKKGVQNYISIPEMAAVYYRIYKGQMVSENASRRMLSLLKQHQRTSMIPYIFKESVSIAHMTGYDEDIIIDGGIIFTPHPFILVMAVTDMDIRKAETLMRDITQICSLPAYK